MTSRYENNLPVDTVGEPASPGCLPAAAALTGTPASCLLLLLSLNHRQFIT
jgi:hypothetical protein